MSLSVPRPTFVFEGQNLCSSECLPVGVSFDTIPQSQEPPAVRWTTNPGYGPDGAFYFINPQDGEVYFEKSDMVDQVTWPQQDRGKPRQLVFLDDKHLYVLFNPAPGSCETKILEVQSDSDESILIKQQGSAHLRFTGTRATSMAVLAAPGESSPIDETVFLGSGNTVTILGMLHKRPVASVVTFASRFELVGPVASIAVGTRFVFALTASPPAVYVFNERECVLVVGLPEPADCLVTFPSPEPGHSFAFNELLYTVSSGRKAAYSFRKDVPMLEHLYTVDFPAATPKAFEVYVNKSAVVPHRFSCTLFRRTRLWPVSKHDADTEKK